MDFKRISSVIDFVGLACKKVTVFGAGASVGLISDLCRCGVQRFRLVDPDQVGPENMARQGHDPDDIGKFKVDAVRDMIHDISQYAEVETVPIDCTDFDDDASDQLFGDTNLFIAATDSFKCQAYVNRLALMVGCPAVFIGIYAGGMGGEVVWIDPARRLPCFRCICSRRYEAQELAKTAGVRVDPTSDGADIFSVRIPDAIAGQVIVGLLTQGAENRYGRLIEKLGDRQFIMTSLSPEFSLNGRDTVRANLQIGEGVDSYFCWNSIALADPDRGQLPCPDCAKYRGHRFEQIDGDWQRIVGDIVGVGESVEDQVSI
jgi:hypothetical protein